MHLKPKLIALLLLCNGLLAHSQDKDFLLQKTKKQKKADARVSLDFRDLRVPGFQRQTIITYPALSIKWNL